jgi:hypothetical protein
MSDTPEKYQKGLSIASFKLRSNIAPTISKPRYASAANRRGPSKTENPVGHQDIRSVRL